MSELSRRQLLLASAGTALTGLAGCTSSDENPNVTTTGEKTATPEETDTPTTTSEPTTEETTSEETESDEPHRHGTLMLETNGDRIDFSQSKYLEESTGNPKFHFHDDDHQYKWHNHGEPVTLAYALNTLPGIEYEEKDGKAVLAVDGATYRQTDSDTTLVFRQRTTDIEPKSYELKEGDIMWVKVYTDGNTETPHE